LKKRTKKLSNGLRRLELGQRPLPKLQASRSAGKSFLVLFFKKEPLSF
jgi:hypothetical protein